MPGGSRVRGVPLHRAPPVPTPGGGPVGGGGRRGGAEGQDLGSRWISLRDARAVVVGHLFNDVAFYWSPVSYTHLTLPTSDLV